MKLFFKFIFCIALLCVPYNASYASEIIEQDFQKWVSGFVLDAKKAGISKKTVDDFLKNVEYLPKVVKLDRRQPSKVKSFAQYQKIVMPQSRIKKARKKYKENKKLLDKIGKKYGVQPRFIVALWGVESDFGRNMGSFNIPNSLATLAFDGRRRTFFTKELINALKIIDNENLNVQNLKGSWAGAMGQTQFMPSSFLSLAVDYNNDGKKDIWGNKADAFASIANYLAQAGWDDNLTWGREVKLPKNFNQKLIGKNINNTLAKWQALGVRKINGSNLPQRSGLEASLIKIEKKKNSRVFLVYKNYKIILKWNRSRFFATTVGMLSDQITR